MNSTVVFIIIMIGVYVAMYATNPLITFFHELGHAIAFLILTDANKINIYIGSQGNKASKINFKIGRLYFHISPRLSIIGGGLCSADEMVDNYIKKIVILLAGPLFTVVLACILGILIFDSEIHGAIKLYFFCLIIFALRGLWYDLVPRLFKEYNLYNDGKLILFTFRIRQVFANYVLAEHQLSKGEFEESINNLKPIVARFPDEEIPLRLLITALIFANQFEEAKIRLMKLKSFTEFMIDDYTFMGYIHVGLAENEEAAINFYEAFKLNPNSPVVLNNLGYISIELENYEEAEYHLERVIKLSPRFAEPYNNLGKLKMLTNELEEGKALFEKSIALNPEKAAPYRNLGDLYLKAGNMDLAKVNFDKALELDSRIP